VPTGFWTQQGKIGATPQRSLTPPAKRKMRIFLQGAPEVVQKSML
jgi:hypothetical protein